MQFEIGSQSRGSIFVTVVLLISAPVVLPGAALSVAQERSVQVDYFTESFPAEIALAKIDTDEEFGRKQLLYSMRVVEVPTDKAKAIIDKWNPVGGSTSNTVVPASFTGSTTTSEFRISDALGEEQINAIVKLGKVVSSPNIIGRNGAEVNVRVGHDVQFVAAYEAVKDEDGNESATMQPKFGTIHDGIKLGLTGAFDDKKENVQLEVRLADTQFKGMGNPFTYESKNGPLTVQQPDFTSTGVQIACKAPINKTFALCNGPIIRESVVERSVPLIGRVPYVGKHLRTTSKATDSITTIILIRCQEHKEAKTVSAATSRSQRR